MNRLRDAAGVAAVAAAVFLACERRPAPPPLAPLPAERWWVAACGDVQPLGVGHDIVPPKLVHRVEPQFRHPPAIAGTIIIATVLTDRGEVCAARILRGLTPEMNDQALAAVTQWRFTPVLLNGQPRHAFYNIAVPVR